MWKTVKTIGLWGGVLLLRVLSSMSRSQHGPGYCKFPDVTTLPMTFGISRLWAC